MTEQKTPHTQTHQNTKREQSDLEADQVGSTAEEGEESYVRMEGEWFGPQSSERSHGAPAHNTEPETSAHQGHQ